MRPVLQMSNHDIRNLQNELDRAEIDLLGEVVLGDGVWEKDVHLFVHAKGLAPSNGRINRGDRDRSDEDDGTSEMNDVDDSGPRQGRGLP